MKHKFTLIILICVLLLNNLAIMKGFSAQPETSSPVINALTFQLTAFINQPFEMVNKITTQGIPLFSGISNTQKSQNKNHSDNNKCLFRNARQKIKLDLQTGSYFSRIDILNFARSNISLDRSAILLNLSGFIGVFLLVYLVLLSQSNLPWSIVKLYST
jgi:hypothetical protein